MNKDQLNSKNILYISENKQHDVNTDTNAFKSLIHTHYIVFKDKYRLFNFYSKHFYKLCRYMM